MVKRTDARCRMPDAGKASLIFLISLMLLALSLQAQDVRLSVKPDKQNVSIGDWITLHLEVSGPKDLAVTWPSFHEVLKDFELVKQGEPITVTNDQNTTSSVDVVVTKFDEGKYTIPELNIQYSTSKNRGTLQSNPISIGVAGIKVDTSKDIKDIKPPLSLRLSWQEILPYLLGAIGAVLLVWAFNYIRKKRKKGEKVYQPQVPSRPAHEVALEALRNLEAEKLWQQGRVKEYHSRISDILRTYIEQSMSFNAMEMTTDLILSTMQIQALNQKLKDDLQQILERADLVKFAKFQPLADEHETSIKLAVSFVTTPKSNHEDSYDLEVKQK
ncbi:BatD family protein, partial [bacterium]|nr:BatD family protein [bacterium]